MIRIALRRISIQHDWLKVPILLLALFLFPGRPTSAQTFQFLPEVNAYTNIQTNIQFNFQAKETRKAGDPTRVEIGPSFDFYLKPLARIKNVSVFDLDDAKSRPVVLSVGFRYVPSPDKPHIERMIVAATFHVPLVAGILLSDRNRSDLDWSQNNFTWRYRNRLTLEREMKMALITLRLT
jgi:hypothetical protein